MIQLSSAALIAIFLLGAAIGALLLAIHRAARMDHVKEQFEAELRRLQLEILREGLAPRERNSRNPRAA